MQFNTLYIYGKPNQRQIGNCLYGRAKTKWTKALGLGQFDMTGQLMFLFYLINDLATVEFKLATQLF